MNTKRSSVFLQVSQWSLRWEKARLERRMRHQFDPRLSLQLDRLLIAEGALADVGRAA